jgi:hypothetical protein
MTDSKSKVVIDMVFPMNKSTHNNQGKGHAQEVFPFPNLIQFSD